MYLEAKDLLELRLYNVLAELENEKLKHLDTQEQNLRITQALIDERRKSSMPDRARIADKLGEIEQYLESKYDVEPGTPIDAETGEIKSPPPQTTPSSTTACPAAGFGSRSAVAPASDETGPATTNQARKEVAEDALEGIREGG